jgi:hypothetical protein
MLEAWAASLKAAVVMTNPGGTGNPARASRASPAPLPPASRSSRAFRLERKRIGAAISALPLPLELEPYE